MATKQIHIDISQLTGYSSVSEGTHNIQIKSKYSWRTSSLSPQKTYVKDLIPNNYITFSSSNNFRLAIQGTKQWDGKILYSTNKTTWTEWDGTTVLYSAYSGGKYNLYLAGKDNTVISNNSGYFKLYYGVSLTYGTITVSGKIDTLLDYRFVDSGLTPNAGNSAMQYLFKNNTDILYANLTMRSLTITSSMYEGMFEGCTHLKNAPVLPSTSLNQNCYKSMFEGCR